MSFSNRRRVSRPSTVTGELAQSFQAASMAALTASSVSPADLHLGLELDPHGPDDVVHEEPEVALHVAVVPAELAGPGAEEPDVPPDLLVGGAGLGDPVQEQPVDPGTVEDVPGAANLGPGQTERAGEAAAERAPHRSNPGGVNDTRTGRVRVPGFRRRARRASRVPRRPTASLSGIFETARPAIW